MRARGWAAQLFVGFIAADVADSFLLKELIDKRRQEAKQAPKEPSVIEQEAYDRCKILENADFYPTWQAYNDYWANLTNSILKMAGFPHPLTVAEPWYIDPTTFTSGIDISRDSQDCDYCKANFDVEIQTCAAMCEQRTLAAFEDFVNRTIVDLGDIAMGIGGNPMPRIMNLSDLGDAALDESMKIMAPCATCTFSPLQTYSICFSHLVWDPRNLMKETVERMGVGQFVDVQAKDPVTGDPWDPKMEELGTATDGQPWKWPSDGRRRSWAVRRRTFTATSVDPFLDWPNAGLKSANQALKAKRKNVTADDLAAKGNSILAKCKKGKMHTFTTHRGYLPEEEQDV